jgi:hypothetical protein
LKAKNKKIISGILHKKKAKKQFMSIKMRIENKKMKKLFQRFTSMH